MNQPSDFPKRSPSRLLRMIKWTVLIILIIWSALTVNAWRYFSASGIYGAYLSALYSVHMLNVPPDRSPETLDGRIAVSRSDLVALTKSPLLRFHNDTRRELRGTWEFNGPNSVFRSSSIGVGLSRMEEHYFLNRNSICFFEESPYGIWCKKLYRDPNGQLFSYFRGVRGSPAGWSRVEIDQGGKK